MRRALDATIPILLYHSVAERPASAQAAFTVTPAAFREHVRALAACGRTALTVSELAAAMRGERQLPARPLLVTFDDGFADARGAVELLLEAGLAATVFVTSGWLGRPAMLTPAGLRGLAALGPRVEIGAHSVHHPRLDELAPPAIDVEVAGSRAALEDVLHAPVRSFAYPHGSYDRRVRAATVAAGFEGAAAVKNALSHRGDDPFALARVTVTSRTTQHQIEALLAGHGARVARQRERLRTRGYRSVRRLRRQLTGAAP